MSTDISGGHAAPERLERRATVARLLAGRADGLVITSLGNPTYDAAAAGDDPRNFYVWGAMGGACMIGLGVAQAQPGRQVLVLAGDGEMMMGLGSLATIAVRAPANLRIVVIDNEHYAETGMQPAHSGKGVDLAGVAAACGFADTRVVVTAAELDALADSLWRASQLSFAVVKVGTGPVPVSLPPRDGPYLRSRFREAVLGPGKGAHD